MQLQSRRILDFFIKHRKTLTISVTLISANLITGYLGNSMVSPNASMGSIFNPLPVHKSGLGAINGNALNQLGLPLTGTTLLAVEQGGLSKTKSLSVTAEGKYMFQDVSPRKYVIFAAFPDDTITIINNVEVEPNSVQTLIFKS